MSGIDEEVPGAPAAAGGLLPRPGAVVAWVVATALLGGVGGWVGLAVGVVIAAISLAGLPTSVLGTFGVVCLAATPVAVLVEGLPSEAEVSPAWVTATLLPSHLTFAGVSLICAGVVLGLRAHRPGAGHQSPAAAGAPVAPLRLPAAVAWALVAATAAGAVAASVAVLAG